VLADRLALGGDLPLAQQGRRAPDAQRQDRRMYDDQADGRGQADSLGQARLGCSRLVDACYLPALAFPGQDDSSARRPAG
jgi:hypothetical protein